MTIPRYAAEASLYRTSRSYRGTHRGPSGAAGATVIAQQDPCAIVGGGGGGSGGGGGGPRDCPPGRRCCERDLAGRCTLCIPNNAQCP
jgi:hypothetical protein